MAHQKPSLLEGGWGDWLSDQSEKERIQRLQSIGIDEGLIQGSMGLLESSPQSDDDRMFQENEQFYKDHPTDTLELEPLPYHTQFGRRVYKDQFGVKHSESTTTLQAPNGEWMNIPVIFKGKYVTEQEAKKIIVDNGMLDPENGETIKTYKTLKEAEEAAKERMRKLNDPSLPWNLEGMDWITNFPFEHLDWKGALPNINVPHIPDWLTGRKKPNIPEAEEWNP